MKRIPLIFGLVAGFALHAQAQGVWTSDLGNGTYRNPVLYADYSDPDVIRTGDDYWMTASSFACVPGLQILHSTDLVNWEIVNAALPRLYDAAFDAPSHGNGVWAPAIRFHDGWYYIYWGDPDRGIYMVRTQHPRGAWSSPVLVKAGRGMIDSCPLWDDDGRAYLVHGWAGSRAGFKSVLSVTEMTPDGTACMGEEVLVFDGHGDHPTVEGPKFYKRGGYYYIFAPAGGVKTGWQIVLRAASPFGPYECRTVLHEGNTSTPAPHQGAWVEDVQGDSWFLHFVDRYAYGRVAHLQPMTWGKDDWCIIGVDSNGDGIGEPVDTYRKPASNVKSGVATPADSDEFDSPHLGLQWQWQANPQVGWCFTNPSRGELRLYCRAHDAAWHNLSDNGNLLLQKISAPTFTATAKLRFCPSYDGDRAGLILFGHDYATVSLRLSGREILVEQIKCEAAIKKGTSERVLSSENIASATASVDVWLRCRVEQQWNADGTPRMVCRFAYSADGRKFREVGQPFTAAAGYWIGAKIGLFTDATTVRNDGGWIDADYFRITKK